MNKFDEMSAAVQEAEHTMRVVDRLACKMARMLIGRLRRVDNQWTLAKLKKELNSFNAHTGCWKD